MLLGSVKGQDWVKTLVIAWLIAAAALLPFGITTLVKVLESK